MLISTLCGILCIVCLLPVTFVLLYCYYVVFVYININKYFFLSIALKLIVEFLNWDQMTCLFN